MNKEENETNNEKNLTLGLNNRFGLGSNNTETQGEDQMQTTTSLKQMINNKDDELKKVIIQKQMDDNNGQKEP